MIAFIGLPFEEYWCTFRRPHGGEGSSRRPVSRRAPVISYNYRNEKRRYFPIKFEPSRDEKEKLGDVDRH